MLATAIALVATRPAAAQTEPMVLTWHAPPGCPTEAQVRAEVGRDLAEAGVWLAPSVAVVGVGQPTNGRWEARLQFEVHDARVERRFEAESCQAIASATALVIALWAEGAADTTPSLAAAASTARTAPPEIPRGPVIAASSSSAPAPGKTRRRQFFLLMNGLLDRDTMPAPPAGGVEASAGLVWSGSLLRFRALAGTSFFPSRRSPQNGVEQGDFWLVDLTSRGCLTFGNDQFEVGPCAGAALSIMHGSVVNDPAFQDNTQQWISLLGSIMSSWKISRTIAVFARGEVVAPTTRRSWNSLVNGSLVWVSYKVPAVAGRGAVGVELRF